MVMIMNKSKVIEEIKNKLNVDGEVATKINNIVEETSIIGKKNKEKIINSFISELNVDETTANLYYETVMDILAAGLKDKLKHPFKNLDKES